jgi:hypothetical protein
MKNRERPMFRLGGGMSATLMMDRNKAQKECREDIFSKFQTRRVCSKFATCSLNPMIASFDSFFRLELEPMGDN